MRLHPWKETKTYITNTILINKQKETYEIARGDGDGEEEEEGNKLDEYNEKLPF